MALVQVVDLALVLGNATGDAYADRGCDDTLGFDDLAGPYDVEHIVEGDDCAAIAIRFRARGKGSGVLTDLRQGHAMHFENGRAVKLSAHTSFEEALEAAGLSE